MVDMMGSWGWGCDGVSWTYGAMGGGGVLEIEILRGGGCGEQQGPGWACDLYGFLKGFGLNSNFTDSDGAEIWWNRGL